MNGESMFRLFMTAIVLCYSAVLCAQTELNGVISGRVIDAQTGNPLPGANIYLSNTMLGAAADNDGYYAIYDVPFGSFKVIASFVGYQQSVEDLAVARGEALIVNFKLTPRQVSTEEVLVTAERPKNWKRNLEIFTTALIGYSRNSDKCTILNPEVLDFIKNEKTGALFAQASEMLLIENRALGYRMNVLLFDFILLGNVVSKSYTVHFEELKTESDRERKQWERERERAYYGSQRHFLQKFIEGSYKEEGYKVEKGVRSQSGDFARAGLAKPEDIVNAGRNPDERILMFNDFLMVTYNREKAEERFTKDFETQRKYKEYDRYRGDRNKYKSNVRYRRGREYYQVSFMELLKPYSPVTVYGTDIGSYSLYTDGYMGWERFAEKLPIDYDLGKIGGSLLQSPDENQIVDPNRISEPVSADIDKYSITEHPQYIEYSGRISENKSDLDAHIGLGHLFLKYGMAEAAEYSFRRAASAEKRVAAAHNGLGLVFLKKFSDQTEIQDQIEKPDTEDWLSQAAAAFDSALAIDSEYSDAIINKARVLIEQTRHGRSDYENYRTAARMLERLLETGRETDEACFYLGIAYYHLGNIEKAAGLLKRYSEFDPNHGMTHIYLGKSLQKTGDFEESSGIFLYGLRRLKDRRELTDIYRNMSAMMSPDDRRKYQESPPESRGRLLAEWWDLNDPDIISWNNELLMEHMRRIEYSKRAFTDNTERGYDDRGKIYIQFGAPEKQFSGTGYSDENIRENESWLYSEIDDNLCFDFVSYDGQYQQVNDLRSASYSMDDEIDVAKKLYRNRRKMDGIYGLIGSAAANTTRYFTANLISVFGPVREKAVKQTANFYYAKKHESKPVEISSNYVQFRGSGGKTVVEIHSAVPLIDLDLPDTGSIPVYVGIAAMDSTGNREDEIHRHYMTQRSDRDSSLIVLESLHLKPGKSLIGVAVEQALSGKYGNLQREFTIRNFSADNLMISDLRIRSGKLDFQTDLKTSGDIQGMPPYPYSFVRKTVPLLIYFEVYNLDTNEFGNTHYLIEYKVSKLKTEPGSIGKMFSGLKRAVTGAKDELVFDSKERTGDKKPAQELISIDLSNIPEGEVLFTLNVMDRFNGSSVTTEKVLTIVK